MGIYYIVMLYQMPSSSPDSVDKVQFGSDSSMVTSVPIRRRSSASSTASMAALASAATYTQHEIYEFLLTSKELAAATGFICQLLELSGLQDDILIREFKTILINLMADKFSEVWDIREPKKGAKSRIISHTPSTPSDQHADPILNEAFTICNINSFRQAELLPVSFTLTINPGLVAYTTSDVTGFQPIRLFEARPYLPPKNQEPVDHGADMRHRSVNYYHLTHISPNEFNLDTYFSSSFVGAGARLP